MKSPGNRPELARLIDCNRLNCNTAIAILRLQWTATATAILILTAINVSNQIDY